jgi:hypothetical protein
MSDNQQPPHKPTFFQILFSTIAAAFGVQSSKNRERDFTGGNIYVYMTAGVIFTAVFILVMVLIVKAVLKGSGI